VPVALSWDVDPDLSLVGGLCLFGSETGGVLVADVDWLVMTGAAECRGDTVLAGAGGTVSDSGTCLAMRLLPWTTGMGRPCIELAGRVLDLI